MDEQIRLTQAELLKLLAGMEVDGSGVITLAKAATPVFTRAIKRLESTRKVKVNLSDPANLSYYTGLAINILKANREAIALGGKLISERAVSAAIGLDESTMGKNKDLHNLYLAHKAAVSNIAPVTLDNDYNNAD